MADHVQPDLSIIVSVYNEEGSLVAFRDELNRVLASMSIQVEILYVNDGSVDDSRELLDSFAREDERVRAIHFSRNFGHEAAMLAGIDKSKGKASICLDADLQHPPAKIPEMWKAFQEGNQIVNMVRTSRQDNGFVKNTLSKLFYRFINRISPVKFEANASDFFLISAKVAKILRNEFRERTRFIRGYIQIVGFQKTRLEFTATAREAGESKYNLWRLMLLSFEAIVAFSRVPLHLGLLGGILCALLGFVVIIYSLVMFFIGEDGMPPGYTTLVVLMSFLFSFLFFLIGILGVYIGHIFEESRKRPIYIVETINQQKDEEA